MTITPRFRTSPSPAPGVAAVHPAPELKDSNQRRTRQNLYPSERAVPLTAGDKARVCILARKAFERVHGREPGSAAEMDGWRHEQQTAAVGQGSLTRCLRSHLPALEAHFLDLAGESGQAFEKLLRPELREQAQALAVLRRETERAGLPWPAYPEAICKSKHKCRLEEISPKNVWKLVFTIRNRRGKQGNTARKKGGSVTNPADRRVRWLFLSALAGDMAALRAARKEWREAALLARDAGDLPMMARCIAEVEKGESLTPLVRRQQRAAA